MLMSAQDARGPEDDDKPSFILGGSASSPVENWSGAPSYERTMPAPTAVSFSAIRS